MRPKSTREKAIHSKTVNSWCDYKHNGQWRLAKIVSSVERELGLLIDGSDLTHFCCPHCANIAPPRKYTSCAHLI